MLEDTKDEGSAEQSSRRGVRGGLRTNVLTGSGRAGYRHVQSIEPCMMNGYIIVADYIATRDLFKCVLEKDEKKKDFKNEQKVLRKGDSVTIFWSPVYSRYANTQEPQGAELQLPRPQKRYKRKRIREMEAKKIEEMKEAVKEEDKEKEEEKKEGGGCRCGDDMIICEVRMEEKKEDEIEEEGEDEDSDMKKSDNAEERKKDDSEEDKKKGVDEDEEDGSKHGEDKINCEVRIEEERMNEEDKKDDDEKEKECYGVSGNGGSNNVCSNDTRDVVCKDAEMKPINRRRHINVPKRFHNETMEMKLARKNDSEESSVWLMVQDAKGQRTLWRRKADLVLSVLSFQRIRYTFVDFRKKGVTNEYPKLAHKDPGPPLECYQTELIPGKPLWIDKLLCFEVKDYESCDVEDLTRGDFEDYMYTTDDSWWYM